MKKDLILILFSLTLIAIATNAVYAAQPTMMSLQGKVTDSSSGNPISSGDLRVTVSTEDSCSLGVFFDHTYTGAISDGLFNLLLGSTYTLELDYNENYWLCTFVNDEQVGDAYQFRGGQGQIGGEDLEENIGLVGNVNISGTLNIDGKSISIGGLAGALHREISTNPKYNNRLHINPFGAFSEVVINQNVPSPIQLFGDVFVKSGNLRVFNNLRVDGALNLMGSDLNIGGKRGALHREASNNRLHINPFGAFSEVVINQNAPRPIKIGSPNNPLKITMYSPDGTAFDCGPDNIGNWVCSPKSRSTIEETTPLEKTSPTEEETTPTETTTETEARKVLTTSKFDNNCKICKNNGYFYCELDNKCYAFDGCKGPDCCYPNCGGPINCIDPNFGTC